MADVEIDVVGPQPPQAGFARLDQVLAREADVVRARVPSRMNALVTSTKSSRRPCSASPRISSARAERIHVGGVDRRHARFAADVEHACRLGHAEIAHLAEPIPAANRHRPETEDRYAQPGIPEPPLLHVRCSSFQNDRRKPHYRNFGNNCGGRARRGCAGL